MTPELQFILNITIALATAFGGGLLATMLKQPPLLGYLVAGVMIGPFTVGYVANRAMIASVAEVGVIFLMFGLGVAFSLKELARIKGVAIGGAALQAAFTILCGVAIGMALGWPLMQGIFFGGVIVASTSTVILKTLMARDEVASNHGRLLMSMSLVQDLIAVLLIVMLPQIAGQGEVVISQILIVLLKAGLFIGFSLTVATRVVPRLMHYIAQLHSQELFLVAIAVLALSAAMTCSLLGLSPALGAFMAGLVLSETEYDHRVIGEVIPVRDLFVTLFFVSIGMLIDVRFIIANWPAVIGMGALIMTAKFLSTLFAVVPFRLDAKTAAFTSLGMVPIGELNYIMAQSGRAINAFPSDLYNLILTSSLITIILTPAAFHISPRVGKLLLRVPLLNKLFPAVSTVPQSAGSMENHTIVAGYGRVGVRMARGMRQVGLDVVVIEQNLHLVRQINEDSTTSEMKRMHAIYGDASSPTVLQAAHPEKARIIIIALPDFGATRAVVHRARQMSSDAIIVARAQRTEDDAVLRDAGATAVVVPEIAGSLLLLEEALILLGVPHDHILTAISPLTAAPPAEANTDQTANAGLHLMEEPMMEDQSELGAAGADNSQRVVNEAQ